jgi:hypothetical protein
MDYITWARLTTRSIMSLSRTGQGSYDTSSTQLKPELVTKEGAELSLATAQSLEKALRFAWDKRRKAFAKKKSLEEFVTSIAQKVNKGVVRDGSLLRTWDIPYTLPAARVRSAYTDFCDWLSITLPVNERDRDLFITSAAKAERDLDLVIHPFADGCGRISKVLGAWILVRAGLPPPLFPNRETYYQEMRASEDLWVASYRLRVEQRMSN